MSERDHVVAGVDQPLPLHARLLSRMPVSERARFRKALSLLSGGGGVRAFLEDGDLPLSGLGVYEALLTQSWRVRFHDPAEMILLTKVALEVAQGLDPSVHGEKDVADLKARAWGELANAYRAADQLRSADRHISQAYALFRRGTGDLYLRARLVDIDASLMGTWRSFSLAEDRHRHVAGIYRALGEIHLAGRALISQALYTAYSDRLEEALRLNQEGLDLIDRQRDPALFLAAMHNKLVFLVEVGRHEEAKRQLFESRQHFIYQDRITALRLRAVEGRIEYGLGKLVSAEIAFREVKQGLTEAGLPFYTALVSLELAMVLLSQDRFDEAEKGVLEVIGIFADLEIYREFLGSVIVLEDVFKQRTVTPAMIEATVAHLSWKQLEIGSRHFR